MNPLISVIVPAYNAERYVQRCVSALLGQTYQNLELILVDDGSTDKTMALCRELEQKSEKIKVYSKKNGGAASARNYGLEQVHGDLVAFVDVDDVILSDYIEYLFCLLQKEGADVSMCACYKMRVTEEIPQQFREGVTRVWNQEEAMKSLFYRTGVTGYPYLKLWKREIIQGGRFPEDMLYGEDFVYVYEMLKRCSRIVYGEKIEYIYYQNPESVDHGGNYRQLAHSWHVYTKQIMGDVQENYPSLMSACIARNYISAANIYNRVADADDELQLRVKLSRYIKRYGFTVFMDRECKLFNRLLGLIGGVSPTLLYFFCQRFYDIKRIFHFELRKAV